MLKICVLMENGVRRRHCQAEHGLAIWIDAGSFRVLFDTGQSSAFVHNAKHLSVPLEKTDAIVLSHGHYDHTGGLPGIIELAPKAKIFAHPAAITSKFSNNAGNDETFIGMVPEAQAAFQKKIADVVWTKTPTLCGDLFTITGEIPRLTSFESVGTHFFRDAAFQDPDLIEDDQALYFSTPKGTVVVLGCAHSGVINMLQYIRKLTDGAPIASVIGGMHLEGASQERLEGTIDAFNKLNIRRLHPGHCTGLGATFQLMKAFPKKCVPLSVGLKIDFELE